MDWGRLCAGKRDGDGSPHPRGHRRGGGLDSRPVFTGAGSTRESGMGMGPRIREIRTCNTWGERWDSNPRSPGPQPGDTEGEVGWIPAPVFTGAGSTRECGMGMGHPRGHRRGGGLDSRPCLHGGRLYAGMGWGWVPASARTQKGRWDGFLPRLHGGRLYAGMWDGSPHPRGHRRGGGLDSRPVFTGAGSTREEQVRVSAR